MSRKNKLFSRMRKEQKTIERKEGRESCDEKNLKKN